MRKVKTTLRPDETIDVGEAEFLDLDRQGLISEEVSDGEEEAPAKESGKNISAPSKVQEKKEA